MKEIICSCWVLSFPLMLALLISAPVFSPAPGQNISSTGYPAPRFPSYLKSAKTVEELMPKARAFVLLKQGTHGIGMGTFDRGDTLLRVTDITAEPLPLAALRRALEERGIKVILKTAP